MLLIPTSRVPSAMMRLRTRRRMRSSPRPSPMGRQQQARAPRPPPHVQTARLLPIAASAAVGSSTRGA